MKIEQKRCTLLTLALLAALPAPCLYAQSAADETPTTLSALKVTAQKREESLQNVPVVVSVLPEQLLQDSGVHDIKELQVLVPGLIVTSSQSAAQTTARIRGIGTVGDNAGLESSVGVVIDGVARARNGVSFADLGELERIEVLKGPQGTVFGKNTSAGVINVVTRRPSFTRIADAELTAGNYGALGVASAFNDALGETSALRVYAARRSRDGFEQVVTGAGPRTATDDGDQNLRTARVQLLWEPTEDLDINLAADATSRKENCCVTVTTERGPTAALIDALAPGGQGTSPRAEPARRRAYSNRSTAQDIQDRGVSAQVDWATPWLNHAVLTSITALRDWKSVNGLDFDYGAADILYREPRENEMLTKFRTFSQELRLAGSTDSIDWLVGAFYADETLHRNESYRFGSAYEPYLSSVLLARVNPALAARADATRFLADATGLPAGSLFRGQGSQDRFRQDGTSAALFTNNTWHATDALDVVVGLRYTYEHKALRSAFENPDGSPACASYFAPNGSVSPVALRRIGAALTARGVPAAAVPAIAPQVIGFTCLPWANSAHAGRLTEQRLTERAWSGTAKLAYRWNDALMTYASAARGYKAGGFNLDRVQSSDGLSSGVQGILPVDDTAFPGEFVDSYELGAKTTWLGGNLLLNATLFYQNFSDFQLNNFLGTSFVVRAIPTVVSRGIDTELLWQGALPGLMLQGGLSYADTTYGDDPLPDTELALLPGSRLSFAPRWSANLSVTYEHAVGNRLTGRFNVGAKYTSEYNAGSDLDPQKAQPGYTLLNARVGVGADDKRWLLEAWAENLGNETYRQIVIDTPLQAGSWNAFLGAPRTYGVTLRLRY